MKIQVVADSSANLLSSTDLNYSSVPLTIVAGDKEYRDDDCLDLSNFVDDLNAYTGKSSTACPGVNDWIEAFNDADIVLCFTLTGHLSGCYNSAKAAADIYMEENPGKRVFVLDSLSTGPELELIAIKAIELANNAKDNMCNLNPAELMSSLSDKIKEYSANTHLAFALKSVSNFAKNGRVNAHLARAAELLHIYIVGRASNIGDLEPLDKPRGESRAISQLFTNMKEEGFNGKKVIIRHTFNEKAAEALKQLIKSEFPLCDIIINANRGLCSYYAEPGSVLVGFES